MFKKKRDCVCYMNMMHSSTRSLVVLRSTILGSCANESSVFCDDHTVFYRFFYGSTLVRFGNFEKNVIFVVFFVWL